MLRTHVGVVPNPPSERTKHLQPRVRDAKMFKSVCPYCAVGCEGDIPAQITLVATLFGGVA